MSNANPILKVVGFHVEGVAPSPSVNPTLLSDAQEMGNHTSGSPNPVIIPPSFQVIPGSHHTLLSLLARAKTTLAAASLAVWDAIPHHAPVECACCCFADGPICCSWWTRWALLPACSQRSQPPDTGEGLLLHWALLQCTS